MNKQPLTKFQQELKIAVMCWCQFTLQNDPRSKKSWTIFESLIFQAVDKGQYEDEYPCMTCGEHIQLICEDCGA